METKTAEIMNEIAAKIENAPEELKPVIEAFLIGYGTALEQTASRKPA